MKKLIPFCLILIFTMIGCLPGRFTRSPQPDVAAATSETKLHLSIAKATYAREEAIPLALSIQNGTFDLLVPFGDVATVGAFAQLTVRDVNGNIVKPKRPITKASALKTLMQRDKLVQCIQGFELKAGARQVVSLKDLQKYYRLPAGNYTVSVVIALEVYQEFLKEQHPQVIALEQECMRIQKVRDAHVTAADKRQAIAAIRNQIEVIEEKHKDDIYLPVKSLRGEALLSSNSVALTIE